MFTREKFSKEKSQIKADFERAEKPEEARALPMMNLTLGDEYHTV